MVMKIQDKNRLSIGLYLLSGLLIIALLPIMVGTGTGADVMTHEPCAVPA
jgi:Cu/Ag efflux pump CusA